MNQRNYNFTWVRRSSSFKKPNNFYTASPTARPIMLEIVKDFEKNSKIKLSPWAVKLMLIFIFTGTSFFVLQWIITSIRFPLLGGMIFTCFLGFFIPTIHNGCKPTGYEKCNQYFYRKKEEYDQKLRSENLHIVNKLVLKKSVTRFRDSRGRSRSRNSYWIEGSLQFLPLGTFSSLAPAPVQNNAPNISNENNNNRLNMALGDPAGRPLVPRPSGSFNINVQNANFRANYPSQNYQKPFGTNQNNFDPASIPYAIPVHNPNNNPFSAPVIQNVQINPYTPAEIEPLDSDLNID